MDTASQTLLIVVSTVLSIFLIVMTIGLIIFIQILRQVKRLTERAETAVDSVEAAASTFKKAASPLVVLKMVGSIVENAAKMRKRKD